MNVLSAAQWQSILPKLRAKCPRLTEQDLSEAECRVDLLIAKVQNRHWVSKIAARRTVLALLADAGIMSIDRPAAAGR